MRTSAFKDLRGLLIYFGALWFSVTGVPLWAFAENDAGAHYLAVGTAYSGSANPLNNSAHFLNMRWSTKGNRFQAAGFDVRRESVLRSAGLPDYWRVASPWTGSTKAAVFDAGEYGSEFGSPAQLRWMPASASIQLVALSGPAESDRFSVLLHPPVLEISARSLSETSPPEHDRKRMAEALEPLLVSPAIRWYNPAKLRGPGEVRFLAAGEGRWLIASYASQSGLKTTALQILEVAGERLVFQSVGVRTPGSGTPRLEPEFTFRFGGHKSEFLLVRASQWENEWHMVIDLQTGGIATSSLHVSLGKPMYCD